MKFLIVFALFDSILRPVDVSVGWGTTVKQVDLSLGLGGLNCCCIKITNQRTDDIHFPDAASP